METLNVLFKWLPIVIFTFACETQPRSSDSSTSADSTNTIDEQVVESMAKFDPTSQPSEFGVENDLIKQRIYIQLVGPDSMEFIMRSHNKMTGDSCEIEGVAVLKEGVEVDQDENGTGYLAEEFIYKEKCWLAIRIDLENMDKVQTKEFECENFRSPDCPFASVEVMRP